MTPQGGRPGDRTPSGPAGPLRSYMKGVRAGDGAPRGPTLGPLQRKVCVCLCPGDPAPIGPPLGPLRRSVGPPVRAGDQAPGEPTLGPLMRAACVRPLRGPCTQWATTGAPDGHTTRNQQGTRPAHPRPTEWGSIRGGRLGQRVEKQGTWASRTRKRSEAGCGRPEDGGGNSRNSQTTPATTSTTPIRQLPGAANAQTHPAEPQHTNHWAPRTRKRHQQEHHVAFSSNLLFHLQPLRCD